MFQYLMSIIALCGLLQTGVARAGTRTIIFNGVNKSAQIDLHNWGVPVPRDPSCPDCEYDPPAELQHIFSPGESFDISDYDLTTNKLEYTLTVYDRSGDNAGTKELVSCPGDRLTYEVPNGGTFVWKTFQDENLDIQTICFWGSGTLIIE